MYYFFGAGVNCNAAIKFFGKKNIKAIVDNSTVKTGRTFEGIPVVSFDHFLKIWNGETVVITAYIKSNEIIKQLEAVYIQNYFVCPYMLSGLFSHDKIFKICNLEKYTFVGIYGKNPIGERIVSEIKKRKGADIDIYLTDDIQELKKIPETGLILNIKEGCIVDNKVIVCKNIINLYEELNRCRSVQYEHLRKFKNIHQGKRCFIIGNGPSLTVQDLDRLYSAGDISFGSNKIYNIFNDTEWRPDYYVIGDSIVYSDNKKNIPSDSICFIRDFYGTDGKEESLNWYPSNGEKYYPGYPGFSDDLVQGVYGGRTVTYDMLQIAVYMGFEKIYLLGIDFSWGEGKANTHFYKSEEEDPLIKEAMQYKDEQRHAYISARKYTDSHGIKIYNATRGGNLDVFERVDFETLFSADGL